MTSVLIILCVAFFATGSATLGFVEDVRTMCRNKAKEKLDADKCAIKLHYDSLQQQALPFTNKYIKDQNTIRDSVLREFGDASSRVTNLNANEHCRQKVNKFNNALHNARTDLNNCWTEAKTRLEEARKQFKDQFDDETKYLEGYKDTVDTLTCLELSLKKRPFRNRKANKLQQLTATYENLVRTISTESANLSNCVQGNKEYVNFKRDLDANLASINSCLN